MWLPVLCVSTKRVFVLDYKTYILSLLRAWRLSRDVLEDAGFQCEKASVLRETMKDTRCTSMLHPQPFGPRICSSSVSSHSSTIRSYFCTLSLGLSSLYDRAFFFQKLPVYYEYQSGRRCTQAPRRVCRFPSGMFKLYMYLNK